MELKVKEKKSSSETEM